MFNKSDGTSNSGAAAHTLVSRSTEVVGDIHFTGELIIEGRVKGNIYAEDDSSATIRVTESGAVEGEICVPSAIINGFVQGDVRSANHIELAAKAVISGNVYYNLIEMVMGSSVNGNLMHINGQQETKRLTVDKPQKLPYEGTTVDEE